MQQIDRFSAILWDNDGVLVDTEHLYYQATRAVMRDVGVELDLDTYREWFLASSLGAWHLVAEQGHDELAIERMKRDRDARHRQLLARPGLVIPGVPTMLALLHGRRPMAIVTSSHREHFDIVHRDAQLLGYFDFVLTREDYAESKPNPEPYLAAAARIGVAPAECLVIEDSPRGLTAAGAAGMTAWAVRSELTETMPLDGAERYFDNVTEIATALLG
ncbi:MAG: HAD family phosphatase [Pseudomonadota bacterium]